MTADDISWTVLQYDLKTAIDVLHMPCLVKLADDKLLGRLSSDNAQLYGARAGSVLKLETSMTVQYVHARVLPLDSVDWFLRSKGVEFMAERSRFEGRDVLIPLDYEGRLMIRDVHPSREYFSIREVVQDFPRFIRVESDVVCAIPGCGVPQVVTAGTILELDRVTANKATIHRRMDKFLICFDRENSRELAFGLNSPGHFKSIVDTNVYALKEFVDRVSLPKIVEFQYTDPRHVICAIDSEAIDIHLILDGPLEILGLKNTTFIVGIMQHECEDELVSEMVAFPNDEDLLEETMVYIPTLCLDENCDFVVHKLVLETANYNLLTSCLYLRYLNSEGIVLLKNEIPDAEPDSKFIDLDDVPPLPSKNTVDPVPRQTLRHSRSTPFVGHTVVSNVDEDETFRKKRYHSDGDVDDADEFLGLGMGEESNKVHRQSCRQPSGIRRYISQISRRMKRTASQLLFGRNSDTSITSTVSASTGSSFSVVPESLVNQLKPREITNEMLLSGFTCHVNCDAREDRKWFNEKLRNYSVYGGIVMTNANGSRSYIRHISRSDYDEPIYTYIDWSTKKSLSSDGIHRSLMCPVCRECRRILMFHDKPDNTI